MPSRRHIVLGFLAGLGLAWSCASSEEILIYAKHVLFEGGTKVLGATNVAGALQQAEADIKALKAGSSGDPAACPAGYTSSLSADKVPVCRRGEDVMVKVGDGWIDRFEATLVDNAMYNSGKCDGSGKSYVTGASSFPSGFDPSGAWSVRVYACSVPSSKPVSTDMTWFQAAQACALAGKRLCTLAEWVTAAAGGSTMGCNTSGGTTLKPTTNSACRSSWGAQDMVGNVKEWIDWWGPAGVAWRKSGDSTAAPWPSTYKAGVVWGLDGDAQVAGKPEHVKGLPAAARMGCDHGNNAECGAAAMNAVASPAYSSPGTGVRCCRR